MPFLLLDHQIAQMLQNCFRQIPEKLNFKKKKKFSDATNSRQNVAESLSLKIVIIHLVA